MNIGIFDSGVGGLTVVKELKEILPNESLIYLGDNARAPYGSKSHEKIKSISLENAHYLNTFGLKMLVIACNTASAVSISYLRENLSIPVVGVIEGSITAALNATKNKRIGIIGTRQTIASNMHESMLKSINPNISVFTRSTPLFAPIVEEGYANSEGAKKIIIEELNYFKKMNVDTLILGCTHYPLLKKQIKDFLPDVTLVDPSRETSLTIKKILEDLQIQNQNKIISDRLLVTDSPLNFMKISKDFLGLNVLAVEQVNLEEPPLLTGDLQ